MARLGKGWWVLLISLIIFTGGCTKNSYIDRIPLLPKDDPRCRFPNHVREGAGLVLSGGGYRATLFHLGALRRLNELGLLHRMDVISSVSGGSMASAKLATYIASQGGKLEHAISRADWEQQIAVPLRAFTEQDIRTGPILKRYLIPWNWFSSTSAINDLAERLNEEYKGVTLIQLPIRPDFVFNATELSFGTNWEMRNWRMGSYQTGYVVPPPNNWSLGLAVAASAAFPPAFQPMTVRVHPEEFKQYVWQESQRHRDSPKTERPEGCWKTHDWDEGMKDLRLSDGGVYDNLGLEPIWKNQKYVFVSDGGMVLNAQPDQGFLWRLSRWTGIMSEQAGALRRRMLHEIPDIVPVYWALKNESSEISGYSEDLAANFLSYIRTDLDGFNDVERMVLENHGYLVVEAAMRNFVRKNSDYIPVKLWPELKAPFPEWLPGAVSECKIKKALVSGFDGCTDS